MPRWTERPEQGGRQRRPHREDSHSIVEIPETMISVTILRPSNSTMKKLPDPATPDGQIDSQRGSRAVYRIALAICIAVISFLAFAPLAGPVLTSNDKINHLAAFLVLAWLAEGAYPGRDLALPRLGLLVFYGLLIEMIQYHLPYRDFSLLDLAADVAGILAYVLLAHSATRLT